MAESSALHWFCSRSDSVLIHALIWRLFNVKSYLLRFQIFTLELDSNKKGVSKLFLLSQQVVFKHCRTIVYSLYFMLRDLFSEVRTISESARFTTTSSLLFDETFLTALLGLKILHYLFSQEPNFGSSLELKITIRFNFCYRNVYTDSKEKSLCVFQYLKNNVCSFQLAIW